MYAPASPYRLCGTFKNPKSVFLNIIPRTVSTIDIPVPRSIDAAKDFFIPFISFAPNLCAVIIANPLASPSRNPIIRLLTVLVEPTAASASSPRKEPTILVSARLYVSCNRFARKIK